MENQGFDIVIRFTPCHGWCCLYLFNGIEKARGRMHREFDDAVFEAADIAEQHAEKWISQAAGVAP